MGFRHKRIPRRKALFLLRPPFKHWSQRTWPNTVTERGFLASHLKGFDGEKIWKLLKTRKWWTMWPFLLALRMLAFLLLPIPSSCQVAMTGVAASLMERLGRHLLLLVSAGGMAVSCFCVGLSFYFQDPIPVVKHVITLVDMDGKLPVELEVVMPLKSFPMQRVASKKLPFQDLDS